MTEDPDRAMICSGDGCKSFPGSSINELRRGEWPCDKTCLMVELVLIRPGIHLEAFEMHNRTPAIRLT